MRALPAIAQPLLSLPAPFLSLPALQRCSSLKRELGWRITGNDTDTKLFTVVNIANTRSR